jgi:hypothetical protein
MTCPVCQGDYFNITNDDICEEHEHWIVTICPYCNRAVLSNESGICLYHAKMGQAGHGANKDRRAPLRSYGLEN